MHTDPTSLKYSMLTQLLIFYHQFNCCTLSFNLCRLSPSTGKVTSILSGLCLQFPDADQRCCSSIGDILVAVSADYPIHAYICVIVKNVLLLLPMLILEMSAISFLLLLLMSTLEMGARPPFGTTNGF